MDAQHHKETLLFVDDEKNILDIVSEYFEFKGFQVLTASNGREAVRVLETERVDCCFTDINMPEMDGLEATAAIRQWEPDGQHIPIIAVTGDGTQEAFEEAHLAGINDLIVKPIDRDYLVQTITSILGYG